MTKGGEVGENKMGSGVVELEWVVEGGILALHIERAHAAAAVATLGCWKKRYQPAPPLGAVP